MGKHGRVALAILGVIALAAEAPVVGGAVVGQKGDAATSVARLTGGGIDVTVRYTGGIGSTNAVTLVNNTKTGINQKNPGKLDFPTLGITRARTDLTLLQWRQAVLKGGNVFKHTVTLDLLDDQAQPVASFSLQNAWPASYQVSALPAVQPGQKAAALEAETLILAYENLTRTR